MARRIVIAGGGFGGLYAARRLERKLPRHSAHITLVSDTNYLLYTPLLPGAAGGTLEPRHVVVPLREELRYSDVRLGSVIGLDPAGDELKVRGADGREVAVPYDYLIVSLGSVSRTLPIPGLSRHGLGFKTIAEAIALRNRAVGNLEAAESIEREDERPAYLTFVFVGGGYAGVEGIAELQDYVVALLDRYPRCRLAGTRWLLVEARDRIMPELPDELAAFAAQELQARGIEVRTSTRLEELTADTAVLSGGERIPCRTLCWTAGVKPSPVLASLGIPLSNAGRVEVDPTLQVRGHERIWAIGDAAAVPDPSKGGNVPCPPTAQHAIRQGCVAADNVAAALSGTSQRRFRYKSRGFIVDLGRNQAVATIAGRRIRGFPAWFGARTYHLATIPGGARKLRLMADWTVGLLFGRASADLGQLGHPPPLDGQVQTPPAEAGEAAVVDAPPMKPERARLESRR